MSYQSVPDALKLISASETPAAVLPAHAIPLPPHWPLEQVSGPEPLATQLCRLQTRPPVPLAHWPKLTDPPAPRKPPPLDQTAGQTPIAIWVPQLLTTVMFEAPALVDRAAISTPT